MLKQEQYADNPVPTKATQVKTKTIQLNLYAWSESIDKLSPDVPFMFCFLHLLCLDHL